MNMPFAVTNTKGIIKSKTTFYNGYRFRSRTEARWAVFFDALEIEYEYEPEGFDIDLVGGYLPDFFLPEHGYIEVKPITSLSPKETLKAIGLGSSDTLHVLCGSPQCPQQKSDGSWHGAIAWTFSPSVNNGWAIAGDKGITKQPSAIHDGSTVIDPRPWAWHERKDGSLHIWPLPTPWSFEIGPDDPESPYCLFLPNGDSVNWIPPLTTRHYKTPRLIAAYEAARQARFEFGENGR